MCTMTVGGTSSEVVMLGNQIHSSTVLKKHFAPFQLI